MLAENKMRSVYYWCTVFTKNGINFQVFFFKSPQIKFQADCFEILAALHADRQNGKYGKSVKVKVPKF